MAYPIEEKLVVGVASSALFDLSDSDRIYRRRGVEAYRRHQRKKLDEPFRKGVAFPFIKRLLGINHVFPDQKPVEVVILSRNSPETGMRIFRSIEHYGLDISRAAFMAGGSPHAYIPAFNASLFLTANEQDVRDAVAAKYPAGLVLPSQVLDDELDTELRVAFDFDGVLADDESETVFKRNNDVSEFQAHEMNRREIPHQPGLMASLFRQLSALQQLEAERQAQDTSYRKTVRVTIVTARNAPAHERMVTTIKSWGVTPDQSFFLGGMEKARILDVLRPHIYFDDQISHLKSPGGNIPMVHVPFGIANRVPAVYAGAPMIETERAE
ncbi:hypothetical protein BLA9940_02825 [Burkholderia aenigmatica]|uniref:5'-nucleotidase n=1 Tax=Burkholderia aenigmatica TaxID=2015348 RepID=A0A6J5IVE9_9BURK|nr:MULTISPECIES: 5'-nucleotidase [Burkholderia]AYQ38050.1 5'-nucleotidase [Burkholderia lata]CAB3963561.1 hypothetical protein BLA3211_02343 [Burkholderia aenigmatica]VWC58983.1 hypothetical protein BLA9940_02825 [Burkholderia aenigmatica]